MSLMNLSQFVRPRAHHPVQLQLCLYKVQTPNKLLIVPIISYLTYVFVPYFDPSNPDDETENANSNMNDQIDDISFTQIVEVSNNHQRSYHPADSNLQSGLAPNDRDHVASSSRADNVEIVHFDTNDKGTMYNTAKEAPTRPVDVITRKLKKKNIKIVTTNIVKILRNAGKKYVSNS